MKCPKVCLVQQAPVFFNLPKTQELACQLIGDYAEQGVDLLIFPETWMCGYPVWLDLAPGAGLWDDPGARFLFRLLHESAVSLDGETIAALSAAAQLSGITVVIGTHERRGKTLYNTMFTFGADGTITPHRKLVPTYTERLVWGRGDGSTLSVVETPFGTLGGLICWEHWMPLARAAMQARHETLHVAQWPEVSELHRTASRHYAFEGGCFVLASGCYFTGADMIAGLESLYPEGTLPEDAEAARNLLLSMHEDMQTPLRRGLSSIYGPDFSVVHEAESGSQAVILDLDINKVHESRLHLDTAGHYSRPDIFELKVDTSPHVHVRFSGDSSGY